MERPPTWTELGLRWTARSRLNLPTPHYLPPTTASTIRCGTATSAIAGGKQGAPNNERTGKSRLSSFVPSAIPFRVSVCSQNQQVLVMVPTIHAYGDLAEDLHFTG